MKGSERFLANCTIENRNKDCNHFQDVGVICLPDKKSGASEVSLRGSGDLSRFRKSFVPQICGRREISTRSKRMIGGTISRRNGNASDLGFSES